jgi:hypothetical protein
MDNQKEIIVIEKKVEDYPCLVCHKIVDVSRGVPWILETDKAIYHTWDYGHRHEKIFEIRGSEQILIKE